MCAFFSSRKPRPTKKPVNNPSPPPTDPTNTGLVNPSDTSQQSPSMPLNVSPPIHSPSPSSSTHSTLLYLQPQYAVLTRSLAECNIHVLIDQPRGVDKNEWIANNSTNTTCHENFPIEKRFLLVVAFFNHVNSLYNAMCEYCTTTSCTSMTGPENA